MEYREWGVRATWTYPDGRSFTGFVRLLETKPVSSPAVMMRALAQFATGIHGDRDFKSVTIEIEEWPK